MVRIGVAKPCSLWLASLTQDNLRLRGKIFPEGSEGSVWIKGVGYVDIVVESTTNDGVRCLIRANETQRMEIIKVLYTEGDAPGVVKVNLRTLLSATAHHLSAGWSNKI